MKKYYDGSAAVTVYKFLFMNIEKYIQKKIYVYYDIHTIYTWTNLDHIGSCQMHTIANYDLKVGNQSNSASE